MNLSIYIGTRTVFLFLVISIILQINFSCSQPVSKQQDLLISQWRGDNRDGVYKETGLPDEWPEAGPELLWIYNGIGKGYAAPVITENKIFVNGEQDSSSFLFAFNLQGELLWKSPNGPEFMGEGFSATYPGSRSTPTVADNLVYATSGQGRIACFGVENGEEKWALEIPKDLGGLNNYFGYSESVVVDNDKVFCFPGGLQNNTVALNRFTGEIEWSVKAMQDTFSYCSPLLVELPEKKVLLTHSRHFLYSLDVDNGEVLGSYFIDHFEYDGEHCNSPLYSNGFIYFIGNEKKDGAVKLQLTEDGKINEVWRNSKVKNNFNGYVQIGKHLYTTVKGNWLKALDINTGIVTDSVKVATGSLIWADNKFICYGMNGDVNLLTHDNNVFNVKSTFKITEGTGQHFSHPVISNGVLYIRHGNALAAYKIK